jgi:hypothetical protein
VAGVVAQSSVDGVFGIGGSDGVGVAGEGGRYGIVGTSKNTGVFGQGNKFGVETNGNTAGVHAVGNFGAGVDADGETVGVQAHSYRGPGVKAASDYGAEFGGKLAPIRLDPAMTSGAPSTGTHHKGELYVDSNGQLFLCIADSTNGNAGTWLMRPERHPHVTHTPVESLALQVPRAEMRNSSDAGQHTSV